MKRTSKLIVALLCLALVLTSSLLVVAACGDKGYTVTASYNRDQGAVSLSAPANGEKYAENENVTVTVTPNSGFEVSGVKVGGTEVQLTDNVYKFAVTADTTVEVTFAEVHNYTVTVNATPAAGGTVTPAGGTSYREGTQVTIAVTPAAKYVVKSVKVGGSAVQLADGKYSFAISANTTVDVEFEQVQFDVTATATPAEGGTVDVSAPADTKYAKDESVTVTVTPEEGYKVASFKVNGEDKALTEGTYTFAVAADMAIEVTFERYFNIEVTVDPANSGTYTLADPANGSYYVAGESVKLTVAAASGYELGRVAVDGDDIEAEADGSYLIKVEDDDVAVEILFVSRAEQVINSLKNSVAFNGTISTQDFIEETTEVYDFKSVFDSKSHSYYYEESTGGIYTGVILLTEVDGTDGKIMAAVGHNPDGTIGYIRLPKITYESYSNPFNAMIASDIIPLETDGTWTFADLGKMSAVLQLIANSSAESVANIESVVITETDGVVTKIEVVIKAVETHNNGGLDEIHYQDKYVINVTDHGTAAVDAAWLDDYAANANADLKTALEASAAATSYTIKVSGVEATPYNIYYTADGVYSDLAGHQGGFYERADGSVWSYTFDDAFHSGEQLLASGGIAALKASFAIDYYPLLVDQGDGVYTIRPIDIIVPGVEDGYLTFGNSWLAAVLSASFGSRSAFTYANLMYDAQSLKLTIADGKLSKVEAVCIGSGKAQTVTLEFGNWSSATLPVTIPADAKTGSIPDSYKGTWSSDDGAIVLDINIGDIYFNDVRTTNVVNNDGTITFKVGEASYTLTATNGEGDAADQVVKLTLSGGNLQQSVDLVQCDWIDFIGEYNGAAANVTIKAGSISAVVNGNELKANMTTSDIEFKVISAKLQSGTGYAYVFTLKSGDTTLYLMTMYAYSIDTININQLLVGNQIGTGYSVLRDATPFADLTDWLGTYTTTVDIYWVGGRKTEEPFVLDITEDGIYATLTGEIYKVTLFDITMADENSSGFRRLGIYFDGLEYYVVESDGLYWLNDANFTEEEQEWVLTKVQGPVVPVQFRGNWASQYGEFKIEIGLYGDEIVFWDESGYDMSIDSYNVEGNVLTFECVGVEYTLTINDDGTLILNSESVEKVVLKDCPWFKLLGEWVTGTEVGIKDGRYMFRITYDGFYMRVSSGWQQLPLASSGTITYGGKPYEAYVIKLTTQEIWFTIGIPTFLGEETNVAFLKDAEGLGLLGWLWPEENYGLVNWARDMESATYKGTASGVSYTLTLTISGEGPDTTGTITLQIDGGNADAAEDIIGFMSIDFFYLHSPRTILHFTVNDVSYQATFGLNFDYVELQTAAGLDVILDKDVEGTQGPLWAEYIGLTFKGEVPVYNAEPKDYEYVEAVVEITKEGVYITIDGNRQQATIISYDEAEGFVVAIGEDYYYITEMYEDGIVLSDGYEYYESLDLAEGTEPAADLSKVGD